MQIGSAGEMFPVSRVQAGHQAMLGNNRAAARGLRQTFTLQRHGDAPLAEAFKSIRQQGGSRIAEFAFLRESASRSHDEDGCRCQEQE